MNRSGRPDEHPASRQHRSTSHPRRSCRSCPSSVSPRCSGPSMCSSACSGAPSPGSPTSPWPRTTSSCWSGGNPLHNSAPLAVGALWLASSRTESAARTVSILIGAVYLVVGVLGLFINGSSDLNLLNINQPDNALHLASGARGLYLGLAGRRSVAPAA